MRCILRYWQYEHGIVAGLSFEGLVKLYASSEQLGKKGSPLLAGSFALIVSALLVCVSNS